MKHASEVTMGAFEDVPLNVMQHILSFLGKAVVHFSPEKQTQNDHKNMLTQQELRAKSTLDYFYNVEKHNFYFELVNISRLNKTFHEAAVDTARTYALLYSPSLKNHPPFIANPLSFGYEDEVSLYISRLAYFGDADAMPIAKRLISKN